MKLKKPAKDHRGSWDLVLDNEGFMIAALFVWARDDHWSQHVKIMWPQPRVLNSLALGAEWTTYSVTTEKAINFFQDVLGVDTAPLEKLMEEKND